MNVLVVNGSPKGEQSNTMQMTSAVLDGIRKSAPEAEIISYTVRDMNIRPCMGCMSCWGKTAGECVIKDDMPKVHVDFMNADVVIYSFPLYFFGMPGPMKTFVDRMMPLMETYRGTVKDIGDNAFHEFRYDVSGKKFYVISSCGYGRVNEIYDSLIKEFNFIYGKDKYTALLCPQSEMFSIPPLFNQIKAYLTRYEAIGEVIGKGKNLPPEMAARASEPMLPGRAMEQLTNNYWNAVTPKDPLPAPNKR